MLLDLKKAGKRCYVRFREIFHLEANPQICKEAFS